VNELEAVFDYSRGYSVRGARNDEDEYKTLAIPDEQLVGVDVNASGMDQLLQVFRTQSVGTRLFVDSIIDDQPALQHPLAFTSRNHVR
jgi:hypothetical protein